MPETQACRQRSATLMHVHAHEAAAATLVR